MHFLYEPGKMPLRIMFPDFVPFGWSSGKCEIGVLLYTYIDAVQTVLYSYIYEIIFISDFKIMRKLHTVPGSAPSPPQ